MARITQIITLFILSLLMMSASCDKGTEGCTDSNACNYDETAAIDDNSCWLPSTGCDCDDPPGSLADCFKICDADFLNDPPDLDGDGNCDEGVIGGCIDSLICNYNPDATHNNDSCAVDLSQYGGTVDGTDCDGSCEGEAVIDGCDNPGCIGGINNSLEPWKIIISAKATFISTVSDSLIGIDSSTVTLGVSNFALDGFNIIEQEGGNSNCADSCYIDIFENPPGLNNNLIRFYFPHEDWIDDLENFNEPSFVQDMRNYDLKVLFSTGIQWDAVIKPVNLTYGSIVEEISISFKLEGAIYKCKFIISIDGNLTELLEGEIINYAVNSNEEIQLFINISNICIE